METTSERFDRYLDHLAQGLGRANRHAGLRGYCTGLMLPLSRKSVEPMAAHLDPLHASARHQALHHFVAQAEYCCSISDETNAPMCDDSGPRASCASAHDSS